MFEGSQGCGPSSIDTVHTVFTERTQVPMIRRALVEEREASARGKRNAV